MSTFQCPSCGQQMKVIPLTGGGGLGGGWQATQSFAFRPGRLPSGAEYSREVPVADLSGIEAGVKTPLLQAAVTGVVSLVLACMVALLRGGWNWWEPVVIGLVVFSIAWWLLLIQSRQLLSSRETTSADPTEAAFSVAVEITDTAGGKRQMRFAQFEAKPEYVRRFALAAVGERLTPEGARLSRRVFNHMRDESLARGLVTWRNTDAHAQGVGVTRAGTCVYEHLIADL